MHCWARRAGYPSVSSRAARQQPRTRPAGGSPPYYTYAVDRLRHLRHRLRPPCGRAVPPVCRPGAGPGEKPLTPPLAAVAGPGAVHHRHRHWAATAARCRCPARVNAPRVGSPPPSPSPAALRAGAGAARAAARAGPLSHRTLRSAGHHSGLWGSGSPDWIATCWAGRGTPWRTRWAGAGAGSPRSDRRGRHMLSRTCGSPSRHSGTRGGPGRRAGSPPLDRRYAPGRTRWGLRRGRYRLGVIAEPTVSVSGPAYRRSSDHSRRASADRVGNLGDLSLLSRVTTRQPGPGAVSVGPQVGALTGPWPAPAAGLRRAGRAGGPGYATDGAAGRARTTAGAGRRLHVHHV